MKNTREGREPFMNKREKLKKMIIVSSIMVMAGWSIWKIIWFTNNRQIINKGEIRWEVVCYEIILVASGYLLLWALRKPAGKLAKGR